MVLMPFLNNDLQTFVFNALLGFSVGAIIGVEREKLKEREAVGTRSFGLMSLLGALTTYLGTVGVVSFDMGLLAGTVIAALTIGLYAAHRFFVEREGGITTTIALGIAYVLGLLVGCDLYVEAIAVSLFVTFILAVKHEIASLVTRLSYEELLSALELGVLALFLYHIVPDQADPIFHEINLRSMYLVMVILLAIMFANYVIVKKYGTRGAVLFGFFGGLAHSEATTVSLANLYKKMKHKKVGRIVQGVLAANSSMILRDLIIISYLTPAVLPCASVPLTLILLACFTPAVLPFVKEYLSKEELEEELELKEPFSLKLALKFVVVFTLVSFVVLLVSNALQHVRLVSIIASGFIGGIAASGAVTFTACSLYLSGKLAVHETIAMVLSSISSALLNKVIYLKSAGADKELVNNVGRYVVIVATFSFLVAVGYLVYL